MKNSIYLDYAAATPLDPEVLAVMQPYLTEHFANPSSLHSAGRAQAKVVEAARKRMAHTLGAKPTEIIFTSGSTEAANLAIKGILMQYPDASVVVSAIEHEAVLAAVAAVQDRNPSTLVPVEASGIVDPAKVATAIDDMTVLVCVQYANNEIGTIQPISEIAQQIAKIRADRIERDVTLPLYLYCDAAQGGLLNLQVSRLGVDLMSMGGSKLYGPAGIGFLYVRTGTVLVPTQDGGGQESGLRSGGVNVAGVVGLVEALERIQAERAAETKRQQVLRDALWQQIQAAIPDTELNGSMSKRLSDNLNITITGAEGETLVAYLDREGIAIATGSACAASDEEPSHVLLAIGRAKVEAASSIRITIGKQTTKAELDRVAAILPKMVARARQLA